MKIIASIFLLAFLLLLTVCSPVRGFIEAEFTLSPESKLPAWYSELPTGYKREDVKIHLQYYTPLFDVDNTVLLVKNKDGFTLFKETGMFVHHLEYWKWAHEDWPARAHPGYVKITINGLTEIIEHKKMEPIFYVSDEAAVKNTISASQ